MALESFPLETGSKLYRMHLNDLHSVGTRAAAAEAVEAGNALDIEGLGLQLHRDAETERLVVTLGEDTHPLVEKTAQQVLELAFEELARNRNAQRFLALL